MKGPWGYASTVSLFNLTNLKKDCILQISQKYVRPIDPASTWHLLNKNEEDAVYYISSLLKAYRNNDQYEQYWFSKVKTQETRSLRHLYKNEYSEDFATCKKRKNWTANDDKDSPRKFLSIFDWKDPMLQQHEIKRIESFLVEFLDISARQRFDIGINEEFTVKLSPKDDSPEYCQSLTTPINLKEDKLVELASLQNYAIITTLPMSKYASPIMAQKKPNGKLRLLVDLKKINNLISDDYNNNNHPFSTLTDAPQQMAGKKLFCNFDCSQAYHCLQMADHRSKELLAFNFASRTFAYKRLAQWLSRALSAFSGFMREYLDRGIKADLCDQYVGDIGIAANDADQLVEHLRATFECIREDGLKLTMHKSTFGATEKDFLGRTITPKGKNYYLLEKKHKIPQVQESLATLSWLPQLLLKFYFKIIRKTGTILPFP